MTPKDRLPEQRARQAEDPQGYYTHRKEHYRSAEIAASYDETRFRGSRLRRHVREETLLLRILREPRIAAMTGAAPVILDMPAGTGRFLRALESLGGSVISADISREMLSEVRKRMRPAEPMLLQADATMLPLRDGSVDACVSMRFFFHLPRETRIAVLTELARVTRGCVIIDYRHRHSVKFHIRMLLHRLGLKREPQPRVSASDVIAELTAAGLVHEATHAIAPLFSDKWLVVARPG